MPSLSARFYSDVFTPYVDLLKASYRIHSRFSSTRQCWEERLTEEELIRGPYLEKAQLYQAGSSLDSIGLDPRTVSTIRKRLGSRSLHRHQTDALAALAEKKNVVVATGTSSGKTLCFQIPILDDLVRNPGPGVRAVIIYPLNALVNDQLNEWEELLASHPEITFARFTGHTPKDQHEYEERLKAVWRTELEDESVSQQELQRRVSQHLQEQLARDPANRLNHRVAIRATPPNILITNFAMLEYLLERPIDAALFVGSRLRFLVLDEVHAYRGVQATEIAFLIRRVKDRLRLDHVTCIATSATLGTAGDRASAEKVKRFAETLFGEPFVGEVPIYSTAAVPEVREPIICPTPEQYVSAASALRSGDLTLALRILGADGQDLRAALEHDHNLHRLRSAILSRPILLADAAMQLWPSDAKAPEGLESLLEIVAGLPDSSSDLLPTRLHYFVRSQDGLHVCLALDCPERRSSSEPGVFVSRQNGNSVSPGACPACWGVARISHLVELVTCRRCGYLFGALQDLGPRRAQSPDLSDAEPRFDSFTTELGWAADSFWSYFSVESELPYPSTVEADDDETDPLLRPVLIAWCVQCAKKKDEAAGDNCVCERPRLRQIRIFHRQCEATEFANLYSQQKKLLSKCPNCLVRNGSGLEPLKRFQESDDETGLCMAIPLSHFAFQNEVRSAKSRKLLCFTDHRQRAAAFPSLLEEETFTHDLGRKMMQLVKRSKGSIDLVSLGEQLAAAADRESAEYDPHFFLPTSRYPDEPIDSKEKRNLWLAEAFSYFGIPDSARESAEDLGLLEVTCRLEPGERDAAVALLGRFGLGEPDAIETLQVLLQLVRQRKAFTLPKGRVTPDAVAFGVVTVDLSYVRRKDGQARTHGWLPRVLLDGSYKDNAVTDLLRRVCGTEPADTLACADSLWTFLTASALLIERKGLWKLDHERLSVGLARHRFVCSRCGAISSRAPRNRCIRKACDGTPALTPFDPSKENLVMRWVSGADARFSGLRSEEHTAQISKDLAKRIEDAFRSGGAEGISLLSSTTTFEMGINIGDLQKILLRNAPPSSASYVQRTGRAGRGSDKNAVCVTLCRRSKYDADVWDNPVRLMSGVLAAPTVFIGNRFIAQRHFNAVAFSAFLKEFVADRGVLGEPTQKIRLEPFLSLESRNALPPAWTTLAIRGTYLDFLAWMAPRELAELFPTEAGVEVVRPLGDFASAKEKALSAYQVVVANITDEMTALLTARENQFKLGQSMEDVDRAIKSLLGNDVIQILAKRGFLPRYAFPLDVVTLETGVTRWSRDADVELSRDRGLAIAEFAPGAQVIAHKRVFTSEGLYVVAKTDTPERRYYSRCPNCDQVRTAPVREGLTGRCEVCDRAITSQQISAFVEPIAFSVRVDPGFGGTARHRRSSLVRQRQALTHFVDSVSDSSFVRLGSAEVALKEDGNLFRYNLGPEGKGFMLCPDCGASEPLRTFKPGKPHKRLRAVGGAKECSRTPWTRLAYGYQFQSFCMVIRPGTAGVGLESLAYAFQRGACSVLEVEFSDIGVSWRWLGGRQGATSRQEIVLYDRTPGGSGFVRDAYERWATVEARALQICKDCVCKDACYDCLKDYSNQPHHDKLNRLNVVTALSP